MLEIITGHTGVDHVTSADDASLYRAVFGAQDAVLNTGSQFAHTVVSNNLIRISDGDLVIQGHQARIRTNDYEELVIDNGTPGQQRRDLIVARYEKNVVSGIESIHLKVVKGTPATNAVDPQLTQDDITSGGTVREFPLYRVRLNGINIQTVEKVFADMGGTFTPRFTSAGGELGSASYSHQEGKYLRVNNIVFVRLKIQTTSISIGNASGDLRIDGLPYKAGSVTPLSIGEIRRTLIVSEHIYPRINSDSTYITIQTSRAGVSNLETADVNQLALGNNQNTITLSGFYFIKDESVENTSAQSTSDTTNFIQPLSNNEVLMMAVADLDTQREQDKIEQQLALAELAETLMGGF